MAFFDSEGDRRMQRQNEPAWRALIQAVADAKQSLPRHEWNVLDWGCHTGGLLSLLSSREYSFPHLTLFGVEPDEKARLDAEGRLRSHNLKMLWSDLESTPDMFFNVVVSHEVLYLVELDWFFKKLRSKMLKGGAAFVALGSHTGNSAWMRWREVLRERYGHISYAHDPWEIVEKGHKAGFTVSYRELWPAGYPDTNWYSPPQDGWGEFTSMEEVLAFRRAKLLFQFWPR